MIGHVSDSSDHVRTTPMKRRFRCSASRREVADASPGAPTGSKNITHWRLPLVAEAQRRTSANGQPARRAHPGWRCQQLAGPLRRRRTLRWGTALNPPPHYICLMLAIPPSLSLSRTLPAYSPGYPPTPPQRLWPEDDGAPDFGRCTADPGGRDVRRRAGAGCCACRHAGGPRGIPP